MNRLCTNHEINLVDELVKRKIADNVFHAAHMLNILQCMNLQTDVERIARCELYKAWKMSGENKAVARLNAIAGKAVPVADMFDLDEGILSGETGNIDPMFDDKESADARKGEA